MGKRVFKEGWRRIRRLKKVRSYFNDFGSCYGCRVFVVMVTDLFLFCVVSFLLGGIIFFLRVNGIIKVMKVD